MRHIPEDELHAYLDQALSRSQCVEIECHLATCVRCRHERDGIAALRDRTTSLLGLLVPPPSSRPIYAELALASRGRQAVAAAAAASAVPGRAAMPWSRYGIRAAGIMVAVAAGWSARGILPAGSAIEGTMEQFVSVPSLLDSRGGSPLFGSFLPLNEAPRPSTSPATSEPAPDWEPDPRERPEPRRAMQATPRTGVAQLTATVRSAEAPDAGTEFIGAGAWRTVSYAEAAALTGDIVPRIRDLRVVEIQIQSLGQDRRPLVVVLHQDGNGSIVRTIEGPVDRVAELVNGEVERSRGVIRSGLPIRSIVEYVGADTDEPWRSNRVVAVTGSHDPQTLEALTGAVRFR
ncbi:MAG TPA: zf-HC2 domain-containing protein [Gemmatimonadales bacterium]|nr:zf-HC2 domain-containing protein [Gemmatimonadales bacterium]